MISIATLCNRVEFDAAYDDWQPYFDAYFEVQETNPIKNRKRSTSIDRSLIEMGLNLNELESQKREPTHWNAQRPHSSRLPSTKEKKGISQPRSWIQALVTPRRDDWTSLSSNGSENVFVPHSASQWPAISASKIKPYQLVIISDILRARLRLVEEKKKGKGGGFEDLIWCLSNSIKFF